MRLNGFVVSALAFGGLGLSFACSDEQRGVEEPPYTGQTNNGNNSSTGATSSTGGSSSNAGKTGKGGNTTSTGNQAGDQPVTTAGDGQVVTDACGVPWSEGTDGGDTSCDLDSLEDGGVVLKGDIASDLTLEGGKSYIMEGQVRVMSGATLTIAPCTKLMGKDENALLAVRPGGKIEAVGEKDAPIVFTSSKPKGSRAPGDWGGLILLGNAHTNDADGNDLPAIEGLVQAEFYGSSTTANDGESSGSLVYVRLEYTGHQIAPDNEVNGLTFGAIGSGTKISYVESSNSSDDCFEWFGGAVNADHLIALNCDDDEFDTDTAFSGKVQFAFGRQFLTTNEADSNGFEMDTHNPDHHPVPNDPTATGAEWKPLTTAQWSNVTLCGQGPEDALSPPRYGAVLRRNVAGSITNAIFTGFADGGLSVRDNSPITMTHSLVFGDKAELEASIGWFTGQEANSTDAPPSFCDCWSNPPAPFPVEMIEGGTPVGPDKKATYVGAFKQADVASNWLIGKWVSWDED